MDIFDVAELYFAVLIVSSIATVLITTALQLIRLGIESRSGVVYHNKVSKVNLTRMQFTDVLQKGLIKEIPLPKGPASCLRLATSPDRVSSLPVVK